MGEASQPNSSAAQPALCQINKANANTGFKLHVQVFHPHTDSYEYTWNNEQLKTEQLHSGLDIGSRTVLLGPGEEHEG